jgi:hypothetical protein
MMFIVPVSWHFLLWQQTPIWAYSVEVMQKIKKEFEHPSFQASLEQARATRPGPKKLL